MLPVNVKPRSLNDELSGRVLFVMTIGGWEGNFLTVEGKKQRVFLL